MLTMRAAAGLLEASGSVECLTEAVLATRLAVAPVVLDTATRDALGLMDAGESRIAAGVGTLRVLVVRLPESSFRDGLQRLARRLHNRAPHVLWLIAAVNATGTQAAVVGWHGADAGLRVASFLWETAHVVDSDAETLCALSAVRGDADVMIHAHCLDVLGREGLTRRFYRALESHVSRLAASLQPASRGDARDLALLCATRLLFIRFLEAKGWLNGEREFLLTQFERCMGEGGGFHQRVLLPLFFGTLNTPVAQRAPRARRFGRVPFLNGGLFARTALERRQPPAFADADVGALLEHVLLRFRFTAREDSATWSEASIDPEMLGRAFESLMATGERRAGGVFYTPHALVERLSDHALEKLAARDLAALREVRVLDPACGSGAFLVHVLERLSALRRATGETGGVSMIRRRVLARSVFGVDRNPTAVWLCELRLWLSVVIESDDKDPMLVAPLPNLDRSIRVGDALEGPAFAQQQFGAGGITILRSRYVRATGARKEALSRALDRLERKRALDQAARSVASATHARRETLALLRARDLFGQRAEPSSALTLELQRSRDAVRRLRREEQRLRDGGALAFAFPVYFADAHAAGGFDVVVGNPPWVRLHRIPVEFRERLKREYAVYRDAQWRAGALAAGAAPGFASQIDLAALFVERSLALLRAGGTAALLLPAKLWRSLAGGGVRNLLSTRSHVTHLADVADSTHGFGAVVYPSLLVTQVPSLQPSAVTATAVSVHDRRGARTWSAELGTLAFDATAGAPWLMLEPAARAAFDRVRALGTPLSATAFGPPRLGVKTGCNLAFLVTRLSGARGTATVGDAAGDTGSVEDALLRPALRGDSVRAFQVERNGVRIVWTHDAAGAPLAELPPRAAAWLRRHYKTLATRADAGSKRWWSLFRVDAADSRQPRVAWADFGRRLRAVVLEAGDPVVPLNTCYVVRCVDACDAWALAAVLNSSLASAWLNALAEPARGGFHRYLGWTVGQLPLPSAWRDVRAHLARAGRHASRNDEAAGAPLDAAVMRAYGLEPDEVAALVEPGPCS